jgi:hypothetical protein
VTPLDLPRAIALAARLAESLQRSRARLAAVFPVDGAAVARFDEAVRTEADAFLKRFENLANHMQDQVFRLIVAGEAMREPSALSRRDAADYMEKLGVIADSDAFFDAMRVGNRLSRVYPDEPERQAGQLNAAWSAAEVVLAAAASAEAWAARRLSPRPPLASP